MTDSMKFGPEWLRNMSADTASSNSTNSNSQITNSGSSFGSSGSSGDGTSIINNGNNNNSTNLNTTSSNLHISVNSANSGPLRNTFPEFRYGREEMLLLFDRNCGIPEILPSFKHLFVERVQFPLALVPSTDEELMQGSAPPTQRPVWLQRSPVGFSTSSRGTGRVGCLERGRIRGKSMYHPVFQRPNAMFEDDQRSSAIKTERPWAERNGGAAGGDPTLAGPATIGGLGSSDSWNGNTPASSPRREFSNHPRNMENWRRSRNEEGSSGGDAGTTSATFSAEGGWRMNTSGFQNSHTRWGRSTSWRDDDLPNTNENSGIGNSIVGNSGGIMMMRSNSTIATTHGERLGHSGVPNKQSIGTSAGGVARSISMTTSVSRNSSNIWPNNSNISQIANTQGDGGGSDDMTLPEWAMENPSDIGGTFDASGAFHGAIDDEENLVCNTGENNSNSPDQLQPPPSTDENEISEKDSKEKPTNVTGPQTKTLKENDNCQEPSPRSPTPSNATPLKNSDGFSDCEKPKQNIKITSKHNTPTPENVRQKNMPNKSKNEFNKESSITSTITTSTGTIQNYEDGISTSEDNTANSTNVGDYAERMMKVTDDMIEKLIMDDDDSKDDHMKLSGSSKRNSQNSFVAGMQQSQNSNHHPSAVSPAVVPGGPTGPPNMGMYNMAGMMVDHPHNIAALHQLQQQQMAAVAAAAIGIQPTPPPPHAMNSSSPTDLWLYRDPQAKVQGPFSALEMTEWYRAGYFNENLFVRRACDARYRPLGELIKICGGQMPFSNSHLIPLDLNPTPLHTPIVPVITAQPQANDFVLKSLSEHHQQQQHEKLKGNVTAAADSLSNALKSLINSVDISQVLNMHFQTLQDRFIHNQEMEIVGELSKNECFQRLSAAEQDAVVRQKLQMMVLPEYLTNLTGLSNSLAALNPSAGTQLYDTIAECTKKEQLFNSNHQPQPQVQGQQQQQRNNHHGSLSTSYMNTEDFVMKTKNTNHDMNASDLLNEFNLRMFLNNGSDATVDRGGVGTPNPHGHDFLNEQQMFGSGPVVSGATSTPNSASNTSQSPMMQMWMNSLAANQTTPIPSQQHPLVASVQQSGVVNNQWLNGPLVGIPTISLSREQHTGGSIMGSPKPTPTSMWDVATLEQHVHVQQQQHHEQQMVLQLQQQKSFEDQHHLPVVEKILQQDNVQQQQQDDSKQSNQQQNVEKSKQQDSQQQKPYEIQKSDKTSPKVSLSNDNKSEQNNRQSQQGIVNEKSNQQNKRNSTNNNNHGGTKSTNKAIKNENTEQIVVKKSEEERRREQNEEKRRQKEEKKRQQIEEDKRRLMQAEEEKRRQMQEEEKRQQQIQAQRRKALMGNNASNANNNGSNAILSSPNSNQKSNKEQHRIQSSVAPWSTQTMASKLQGPGLAEIQKAERRERRADQQRQLEIQEKQMRAISAAAEVQDTVLKWNAAPVPVKSFAEIQAEEAKRLAHEQMEIQKRKEQDAHSNITVFSSGASSLSGALNSSSNVASIWSGNKIWGTPANTAGFWEEPFKYNNKTGSGLSNSNNINNNSNVTATLIASQSPTTQKSTTSQTPTISALQQQISNKNIKKSQSVAVMQNASTPPTANSSGASSNQKKSNNSQSNKSKSQKPDNNGSGNEKKSANKNNNNTNSSNKCDDYEAEFVTWCTKSLNNMNAKVDVPTFVSFLRDLESPYEVKDYIRMYLGESKEYIDFAKQFLERRSKYKNLQRAQNAHDDDLCKPALAITPSVNDNGDNKGKQKKVKKNKMTKLDARILGFSVTAAEGRINVGDRDYGDTP